jgi:hypothetical protein
VSRDFGLLWLCRRCEAAYVTLPVLRRLLGAHVARELCNPDRPAPASPVACPFCRTTPVQAACSFGADRVRLLFCRACHAARLERATLEAIQVRVPSAADEARRQADARARVALLALVHGLERV